MIDLVLLFYLFLFQIFIVASTKLYSKYNTNSPKQKLTNTTFKKKKKKNHLIISEILKRTCRSF